MQRLAGPAAWCPGVGGRVLRPGDCGTKRRAGRAGDLGHGHRNGDLSRPRRASPDGRGEGAARDVSRADAKAVVLGEQVIEPEGKQVPFAFEIAYDPARIQANHTYAVQARIEDGGQLRLISDQRYAVITRGAPTTVEIVLKPVGQGGRP